MTDNENKTRTVYVIFHEGSEIGKDCYVGSTAQRLERRLVEHRSNAFRLGNENNKLYRRMREIGPESWVIRPLESAICSKDEIRKLERAWCEEMRSDLNSVSPIRLGMERVGPNVRTVYVIFHEGSEIGKDCYVGSTAQTLTKRLTAHRSNASRPGTENNKLYRRMREIGLRNWVIRPLESAICSEDEIRKLERAWCEKLRGDLNTRLPFQTDEKKREYNEKYREKYHEKNREVLLRKRLEYGEKNREVLRQKSAEYRERNREVLRQKSAEYRANNRNLKKFFCETCEISFECRSILERHNDTLKHQYAFLDSLD